MKRIPKAIIPIIFQNFNFIKTLKIVEYSKKAQELLNIDLETYEIASELFKYLKKRPYDNEALEFEEIIRKFSRTTNTKIRNVIYKTVLYRQKLQNIYLNHKVLLKENTEISYMLPMLNLNLFICGTRLGELFIVNIANLNQNSSAEKIFSVNEHKDAITNLLELKYIKIFESNPKSNVNIGSSSKDKTIRIWNLISQQSNNPLEQFSLEQIFCFQWNTPIFTFCEINENTIAIGHTDLYIINIKEKTSFKLETCCGTIKSMLFKNSKKLYLGSATLRMIEVFYNKTHKVYYSNPSSIINCITKSAFSINDIVLLDDGKIIICEDDHLKICSFNDRKPSYLFISRKNSYLFKLTKVRNHPDIIICCSLDGFIYCWDINLKVLLFQIMTPHVGKITSLFYTNNGGIITSGMDGNLIYIDNIEELINRSKSFTGIGDDFISGPYINNDENDNKIRTSVAIFRHNHDSLGTFQEMYEAESAE